MPIETLVTRSQSARREPEFDLAVMVVTHRAMREDLRRLTRCLGGVDGSDIPLARAHAMNEYASAVLAEICGYHETEERVIWPAVAAAAGQAVDLSPLQDDHHAIAAAVGRAGPVLATSGDSRTARTELHHLVSELTDMLDDHIADVEQQVFPAIRRYLPAEAYLRCERQITQAIWRRGSRFGGPWRARYAQPGELSGLLLPGGPLTRLGRSAARFEYSRLERRAFGASQATSEPIKLGGKVTLAATELTGARQLTPAAQAIGLTKTYGTGSAQVRALADVNVTFDRGRFTAVMGPSGSGKSTLMHCLAGLDRPTSGSSFVGGLDTGRLSEAGLTQLRRDRIGFVFQAFNLVPTLTALENITLPADLAGAKVDRQWLDLLISQLGIADRLTHRPTEMSGGQQQRVACARALINRPELIFADEPTGNLDSNSSADVLAFLRRSVTEFGQSIVMVTHDPHSAAYADRVVFLADGTVVGELDRPSADSVLERMRILGA
jgi:putative ABC transport system ATP-binding protein